MSLSDFVQFQSELTKINSWKSRKHKPRCLIAGDASVAEWQSAVMRLNELRFNVDDDDDVDDDLLNLAAKGWIIKHT